MATDTVRTHWRQRNDPERRAETAKLGGTYSAATCSRAHAETVMRAFYAFHLEAGSGPIVNPFPLDRSRRAGRAHAHHNPLEPFRKERMGRYRPKIPKRIPKRIPDEQFTEVFAGLRHHRVRALLAFWISTAARAEELLGVPQRRVDPGEQPAAPRTWTPTTLSNSELLQFVHDWLRADPGRLSESLRVS
jgi:hypothetical protein